MAMRSGYEPAEPSWLPKPAIHRVAESIAQQVGYGIGDDLHKIVDALGGKITVETTLLEDPEHTGSLYVDDLNDFEIIVPSHTSLRRDRFTIAHELGHYFIHYVWPRQSGKPIPQKVVALRRGSNRIEWEANWFAAGFLMPTEPFTARFQALHRDADMVAKEFDVSARAVEVRAEDLKL